MNRKRFAVGLILPLAVAAEILTAPAAGAVSMAVTASQTRPCSGDSRLSLDARRVGKLIKVKVILATQDARRWWDVRLWQNSDPISGQVRRTGFDGSLSVQKWAGNGVGPDQFIAVARTSGVPHESCSVTVTVGASRTR